MNNKAICRKTGEHFTEGKEYEICVTIAESKGQNKKLN